VNLLEFPRAPRVLVTGASDGLGRETARQLAARGAEVIVHGRSPERVSAAAAEVRAAGGGAEVQEIVGDLASLDAVRALADELGDRFDRLDVLLNNAGVYMRQRELTADGFERTFAVNHLAPFLLTHLLLPLLEESAGPRVVNVASVAHQNARLDWDNLQGERQFTAYGAYALSKLANVLFTGELARRLGHRVTVNCLHPGVISTKLLRQGFGIQGPDRLEDGAAAILHLALAPELAGTTGRYFVAGRPVPVAPLAADPRLAGRFYELSCALVDLPGLPRPAA
jgi:NAD(P)-dependent dehydrogenase (short-subunit alcohol dehydrogenase family)